MPKDLTNSPRLNRRTLLAGSAVLTTGTAATLAFGAEAAKSDSPGAANSAAPPNLQPPVVQTKPGKLRGYRDGKTFTFLGIPYAKAERFELPKPVEPWDGVKNAQAWGAVCPIPPSGLPGANEFVFPHRYWVENEDCQVLNIWSQGLAGKKPVMVWMHGGGFTNGSSMEAYAYDGKNLSEFGDIVVVSLNHRLNILGTLDLSAYGSQYANSRYTGTADLVSALQWVHENIEAFGGDPANVTIFGQSGGGGKVVRMMHMPAAKGLFHKVVAQSGGALNYRTIEPAVAIQTQQAVAAATMKNLNLAAGQIDQLKKVPYHDLIAAGTAALASVGKEIGRPVQWEVVADDRYVMREFCDWADSIPLMAGTVFSEMQGNTGRGGAAKNEWTAAEVDSQLKAAFGAKKDDIVGEFKKAFPHKKPQDALYFAGSSRPGVKATLARKLEKGRTPVWNYLFAYEYPVNGGVTAFHCAEIAFVFHNLAQPQSRLATGGAPSGLALQDKVSRAWINFAKTGNPNQPGLEWKPYTVDGAQTMVFDIVSESVALRDDKLVSLLPAPPPRRG